MARRGKLLAAWGLDTRQFNATGHKQRLYMVQSVQPAPDDLGAKLQQRIGDCLVLHG